MTLAAPDASVIVSTYRQPGALRLSLLGYRHQSTSGFEVVVADDGSGEETADVVREARTGGLAVRHVWHEDRGFRKTEALNRAILASRGTYLIFSDGDCVPRSDLVAVHLRLAERGRFLSGGYLKLPEETTREVDQDAVASGRVFDPGWLRARGYRPGRRRLRLVRSELVAAALDALTPTRPTWNGHASSTWREHIVAVNGFDLEMGYGGEDRALGLRLENLGVRGRQVRHRAVCVHLHHERPYLDGEVLRANRERLSRIRAVREARAPEGLQELAARDGRERTSVRIDPPPQTGGQPGGSAG